MKDDRRFRNTLPSTPSGPAAAVAGFAVGAVAGAGVLGLEIAILGWLGVGVPEMAGLGALIAAYGVAGGVVGALHTSTGVWGGGTAIAWALTLAGAIAGIRLGVGAAGLGVPPGIGTVLGGLLGFAAGQGIGRLGRIGPLQVGAATFLTLTVPAIAIVNLHVLATPGDPLSLAVDGVIAVAALVLAVGLGALSSGEGLPLVPAGLLAALSWGAAWPVLGTVQGPPPVGTGVGAPVVLITVDGLRGDAIADTAHAPNLKRFFDRAAWLRQAQATAPWALPSLASIHTGQLPHHHGAGLHNGAFNEQGPIGARVPTLAQLLAHEGYATAAVSGDGWLDTYGLHAGFTWFADTPARGPLLLLPLAAVHGAGLDAWPIRQDAATVTDRALEVVNAQQGGRWFLWAHYVDTAAPFLSTPGDRAAVGETVRQWPVDPWEASLRAVDREIGRLLDAIPDGALVVVVGTHGVQLEEARERPAGVRPGVTAGHTVFQELIGVPLAFHGKGVRAGAIDRPVSTIDVLPTILDRLQLDPAGRVDGRPIPEVRGGRPEEEDIRPAVTMSARYGREQQAARLGDDKLIVRGDGSSPLMDLKADRREVTARPADARNEQLERRLHAALPPIGAGPSLFERAPLIERLGRWLLATEARRPDRPAVPAAQPTSRGAARPAVE